MSTIRIILKTWATNGNGQTPVIAQYEQKRKYWRYDTEIRLARDEYVSEFDKGTQAYRILPNKKLTPEQKIELADYNVKIVDIQKKMQRIIESLSDRFIELTPENVKSEFFKEEKPTPKFQKSVGEWYEIFMTEKEVEIGKGINSYASTLEHFKEFTKDKGVILFEHLTKGFLEGFRLFLTGKNLVGSTVHKNFKNLRIFLNWVQGDEESDIRVPGAYKKIKVKSKYSDPIGLSLDQFYDLYLFDLSKYKELERTRDIFVFGVSIGGPRDGDLRKLGASLRKFGFRFDESTLSYYENKTGNAHKEIDVNEFGIEVLKKYGGTFPHVPANQRLNKNLKRIAAMLGWDQIKSIAEYDSYGKLVATNELALKEIFSTKFMRKTAATIDNYIGVPTKTSMSRTGHRTFAAYSRYVDVNRQSMEYANDLWNKVHDNFSLQDVQLLPNAEPAEYQIS